MASGVSAAELEALADRVKRVQRLVQPMPASARSEYKSEDDSSAEDSAAEELESESESESEGDATDSLQGGPTRNLRRNCRRRRNHEPRSYRRGTESSERGALGITRAELGALKGRLRALEQRSAQERRERTARDVGMKAGFASHVRRLQAAFHGMGDRVVRELHSVRQELAEASRAQAQRAAKQALLCAELDAALRTLAGALSPVRASLAKAHARLDECEVIASGIRQAAEQAAAAGRAAHQATAKQASELFRIATETRTTCEARGRKARAGLKGATLALRESQERAARWEEVHARRLDDAFSRLAVLESHSEKQRLLVGELAEAAAVPPAPAATLRRLQELSDALSDVRQAAHDRHRDTQAQIEGLRDQFRFI